MMTIYADGGEYYYEFINTYRPTASARGFVLHGAMFGRTSCVVVVR